MSTEIEFNRAVVKLPFESSYKDNLLLAMVEIGSSSLRESNSTKVVREWALVAIGQEWHVMTKICQNAVHCEGHSLTILNRYTKPENYIKTWRKTVEKPYEHDNGAYSYSSTIEVVSSPTFLLEQSNLSYLIMMIEELQQNEGMIAKQVKPSYSQKIRTFSGKYDADEIVYVWTFDISTLEGWNMFEKYAKLIAPFPLQNLRVYGPAS